MDPFMTSTSGGGGSAFHAMGFGPFSGPITYESGPSVHADGGDVASDDDVEEVTVYGTRGPSDSFIASFLSGDILPPLVEPIHQGGVLDVPPHNGGDQGETPLDCLGEEYTSLEQAQECCKQVADFLKCKTWEVVQRDGKYWCEVGDCPQDEHSGWQQEPPVRLAPLPAPAPWLDLRCTPCSATIQRDKERECINKGQRLQYCDGFWNSDLGKCDGRAICTGLEDEVSPPDWDPFK
jgi:hypothetical protein